MVPRSSRKLFMEVLIYLSFAILTLSITWRIILRPTVYGDTPLITPLSVNVLKDYIFNIWHIDSMGSNAPWSFEYLFYIPFLWLSNFMNINLYYLLRVLGIFLAQAAFLSLMKEFTENYLVRWFSSILYVLNPAFITYYNMGGSFIELIILPLLVKYIIRHVFSDFNNQALLLKNITVVSMLLSIIFLVSPRFIVAVAILLSPYIVYLIYAKGLKGVVSALLIGVFFTLFSAPYIFSYIHYMINPTPPTQPQNYLLDFKYTYQELSIMNFIQMKGNIGSPQKILGYLDSNVLNDSAVLLIILLALGVLECINVYSSKRDEHMKYLLTFSSLVVIVIVAFLLRVVIYSNLSVLILHASFIWTLRNPIKLQLVYSTVFSIIAGLGLQKLITLLKTAWGKTHGSRVSIFSYVKRRYSLMVLLAIFILQPVIYNTSAFDGTIGLAKTYGGLNGLYDERLSQLAFMLSNKGERGVIIPFDHTIELYIQFHSPQFYVSGLGSESSAVSLLENAFLTGDEKVIINTLRLLGVHEVVFLPNYEPSAFSILNPSTDLMRVFEKLGNLSCTDFYCILSINNSLPSSVYVTKNILYYADPLDLLYSLDDHYFEDRYVFLSMEGNTIHFDEKDVVFSYKVFIPANGIYSLKCNTNCDISIRELSGEYVEAVKINETSYDLYLPKGYYIIEYKVNPEDRVRISNLTLDNDEYFLYRVSNNFTLSVDFELLRPGENSWNSFYIALKSPESDDQYYIIFHYNGIIELAKKSGGAYTPGIMTWSYNAPIINGRVHAVLKNIGNLYLLSVNNETFFFTLKDLPQFVNIFIGSDNSKTKINEALGVSFSDTYPILLVLHNFTNQRVQTDVLYASSTKTSLRISLDQDFSELWCVVVLNQNYDEEWRVVGPVNYTHLRANIIFNAWIIELDPHSREVSLVYYPQKIYSTLMAVSGLTWAFSIILLLFIGSGKYKSFQAVKQVMKNIVRKNSA